MPVTANMRQDSVFIQQDTVRKVNMLAEYPKKQQEPGPFSLIFKRQNKFLSYLDRLVTGNVDRTFEKKLDVSYIGSMSCLHVPQSCCIYDADTIFQDSFKQIVCDFVRFNLTLSKMCGYYIFSSYGAQDMSDVDNLIDRLSLMRLFSNIVDERLKERIKDEEDNNFEWC